MAKAPKVRLLRLCDNCFEENSVLFEAQGDGGFQSKGADDDMLPGGDQQTISKDDPKILSDFERLCLLHLRQIREALGVGDIHVEAYGWSFGGNDTYPDGVQIDLVLDRADNVINVCELKYSRNAFAIDKKYETSLGLKLATFAGVNHLKKAVHLTMVVAGGLVRNVHAGVAHSVVTLDDLFRE